MNNIKFKINQLKFNIWLKWHKIICIFWNWRLSQDLDYLLEEWQKIDHRKDKSYTGRSFRAWYYIRKVDKHIFRNWWQDN